MNNGKSSFLWEVSHIILEVKEGDGELCVQVGTNILCR